MLMPHTCLKRFCIMLTQQYENKCKMMRAARYKLNTVKISVINFLVLSIDANRKIKNNPSWYLFSKSMFSSVVYFLLYSIHSACVCAILLLLCLLYNWVKYTQLEDLCHDKKGKNKMTHLCLSISMCCVSLANLWGRSYFHIF